MEYRRLGSSGLKVSALSYGSWVTFGTQVDQSGVEECMAIAYEAGVNFFDNAEVYAKGESERLMGHALRSFGWDRSSYILSSKVFWGGENPTQTGLSRKHIHDACHAALKRLQTDYLDLYFCHRPDPETPLEETVRAMNSLIEQGKVMYWGTSEWSAESIRRACQIADRLGLIRPVMEQPQYNMFHRERVEREYRPLYEEYGLGTTIWSPLASGLLTGKYLKGIPDGSRFSLPGYGWLRERLESPEGQMNLRRVEKLADVAEKAETSLAKLAVAWCLKEPAVSTVILGASGGRQLTENLASLDVIEKLDESLMPEISKILDS